ncbi:POK18 protein, partial [Sitta europaea]|nr:POK18 protein [Sitta europaea]
IQLRGGINNLQDLQQPLGEINWKRPILGINNYKLAPLFDLLRGDCDIKSPIPSHLKLKNPLRKSLKLFNKDTSLC